MMTKLRFRIAKSARSAFPLALVCAMASLPAVAITIDTTQATRPVVSTQLAKAEKKQLQAAIKAEKTARKLCNKRIKQARKVGENYTCASSGSVPVPETAVASNTPAPVSGAVVAPPPVASAPPVETPPPPVSGGGPLSDGSGKPPAAAPATPPANPPANPPVSSPAPAVGGSTTLMSALIGPGANPGLLTSPSSGKPEGEGAKIEQFSAVPQAVPEPSSLALLGAGLLGLSLAARRRRQKAA